MNIPALAPFAEGPALALLAPMLLAGCRGIGPATVPRDRFEYSHSIAESWKRQTLLNIVKLRYLDPPVFVDVGQIVAGYSLETALNAGASLPEETSFGGDTFTLGGAARFIDRPTITYTPLTGSRFVKGLMTPLPLEAVFNTIQSGWPADGVLSAAVASINGLRNQEASLSGATPAEPGFVRACELMRRIQLSGAVALRVKTQAQGETLLLALRREGATEEELADMRELRALLGLEPDTDEFTVVFGTTPADGRELAVVTRSILHVMQSIALHVDVPAQHLAEGRAAPGLPSIRDGSDPQQRVRIFAGEECPDDAFVAVPYRKHWFWIDDRDLRAKRAFAFIMFLFTLAETGEREGLPVLTIPTQ